MVGGFDALSCHPRSSERTAAFGGQCGPDEWPEWGRKAAVRQGCLEGRFRSASAVGETRDQENGRLKIAMWQTALRLMCFGMCIYCA